MLEFESMYAKGSSNQWSLCVSQEKQQDSGLFRGFIAASTPVLDFFGFRLSRGALQPVTTEYTDTCRYEVVLVHWCWLVVQWQR